jgi:hypothetical protein
MALIALRARRAWQQARISATCHRTVSDRRLPTASFRRDGAGVALEADACRPRLMVIDGIDADQLLVPSTGRSLALIDAHAGGRLHAAAHDRPHARFAERA